MFVFAGIAFKMAVVPFHMWTPDVYEGAPTPVTAFFASASKVSAVALAVRVAMGAMQPAYAQWQQIVIFAALASIILGAVAAIGQSNIKRLLAYSSINNVGFILVGLAAGTVEGAAAVLFYLAVYVAMTLGAFLVVGQMRDMDGQPVESIASLSGLSRTRPGLAAAMAIFMFSLAGIPPLLGFNAKLAVFKAAVDAGLYPLAVAGFVASVIGAYYYLRVVKVMYFDDPAPAFRHDRDIVEGGLIAASAIVVSPLGWVLLAPLGAPGRSPPRARCSDQHPHRRGDGLDQCRCARAGSVRGDRGRLLAARRSGRPPGAGGRGGRGCRRRAISMARRWCGCGPATRRRRRWGSSRRWRWRRSWRGCCRPRRC